MQEWDNTNFLVNLAGQYADCDRMGSSREIRVDRKTPEGEAISGIVDSMDGAGTDVDSVDRYIRDLVDIWTSRRIYNNMVSRNIQNVNLTSPC